MAKRKSVELQTPEPHKPSALAVINLEADSGAGFEGADKDSFSIPFLALLQKMSPQCDDGDGKYIKGAKAGMFLNTATGEVFDGPIIVIPCAYQRAFVEWSPRESGGGFRGSHKPTDPVAATVKRDDKNRDMLPNGNSLVDTRYHFCLHVKKNGSFEPIVISMSSTQLKKSKGWMTIMNNLKVNRKDGSAFTPPMFSHQYSITTVNESNEKGTWKGFKIEIASQVTNPDLYIAGKNFHTQVNAGVVKADENAAPSATDAETDANF